MSDKVFYARPGQLVNDHSQNVGQLAENYSVRNKLLSKITGSNHDIGKFLDDFQESLYTDKKVPHAPVGAELAWFIGECLDLSPVEKYIFTTSVWCHHVAPRNINNEHRFAVYFGKSEKLAENIIANHNPPEPKASILEKSVTKWLDCYRNYDYPLENYFMDLGDYIYAKNKDHEIFYNFLDVFGPLVAADWKDASAEEVREVEFECELLKNSLDRYIEQLAEERKSEPLSAKRLESYKNAVREFQHRGTNIINLAFPTGMGKTFLGLRAGLELVSAAGLKRIVYALPWTTVIDQVFNEYMDFLIKYSTVSPNALLGRTHHLASSSEDSTIDRFFYDKFKRKKDAKMEDIPAEKIAHLVSSWQTRIVCTTFNQVFNTLLLTRNRYTWRLPQLANSVLIIDEPQGLPPELSGELGEILNYVASMLNMRLIIMTATPPLWFARGVYSDNKPLSVECVSKPSPRTRLVYEKEPATVKESAEIFIERSQGQSSLFVCNTVDSAAKLYEHVKELLPDFQEGWKLVKNDKSLISGKPIVFLLTSEIVPAYRIKLINKIDEFLKYGYKIYVVSTQIIEAGIDLDFDNDFRALGPLDSIIQVAGRCNRGGKWSEPRNVYIIKMVDEDSGKVIGRGAPYDAQVLDKTEEILESGVIREDEYQEKLSIWMEKVEHHYQKNWKIEGEYGKYDSIYGAIENMDLTALTDFSLIKDYGEYEVFVRTSESREVWEDILEGRKNRDAAKYTIRVRCGQDKELPPIIRKDLDFLYIDDCGGDCEKMIFCEYCPWKGFSRRENNIV